MPLIIYLTFTSAHCTSCTLISTSTSALNKKHCFNHTPSSYNTPLHWYHTPALLSLWMEKILSYGWAYGENGTALHGKRLMWAVSTGGDADSYSASGYNNFTMAQIGTPIQQTALFCGMEWLPPFITHDAGTISNDALLLASEAYRDRLVAELTQLKTQPSIHQTHTFTMGS